MAVRNGSPDPVLGDLYPFEDRYLRLDDGTTVHYVEAGGGWLKPTVLLLHGNPTWSFLYRDWIQPLSRVARVVAVDHVGFGRSDHPRDPRYHRLERHVDNLDQVARELRLKRVVPVVHDWGGPIGLAWAARHREDLRGLVVLDSWAFTRKMELRVPWWARALRAGALGDWAYTRRNVAVERVLPRLFARPPPPAVLAGYRHPFPGPESRAALVAFPRMTPDGPGHPDWAALDRVERSLPGLDVPAQVLWGAHDAVFPRRFAWAFSQALPAADEPVFLDAGHLLQEDAPTEAVPRVASFVRSL